MYKSIFYSKPMFALKGTFVFISVQHLPFPFLAPFVVNDTCTLSLVHVVIHNGMIVRLTEIR